MGTDDLGTTKIAPGTTVKPVITLANPNTVIVLTPPILVHTYNIHVQLYIYMFLTYVRTWGLVQSMFIHAFLDPCSTEL